MTVIDVLALPVEQAEDLSAGGPDRYDYSRISERLRPMAMAAQGHVVEGLTSAVRRVIDAGQALAKIKSELPHGEYLIWVQMACGLKPDHAARLIKAAEWVSNMGHVPHLDGLTDVKTLFILSADTTTEEVREWFMERCAAGDPPSRKEVQERKRSAGRPRAPQPAESLALALIRKGDLERTKEALALAERAEVVTTDQVMAEQRLRDLGKQRFIPGADADFHRMKDGSWIRLPHIEPIVDVTTTPDPEPPPEPPTMSFVMQSGLMPWERAADRLGIAVSSLKMRLSPAVVATKGIYIRNGYKAVKEGRGMVRITPIAP